nr:MAG: hypothetical protein [Microvirus sp.]
MAVKSVEELSKDDRELVVQSLEVRIAQVKRSINTSKNAKIAEVLEQEHTALLGLLGRFR